MRCWEGRGQYLQYNKRIKANNLPMFMMGMVFVFFFCIRELIDFKSQVLIYDWMAERFVWFYFSFAKYERNFDKNSLAGR